MESPIDPTAKRKLGITVLEAAQHRVSLSFDMFDHVYVALSGGKDSGALFALALDEARRRGRKLHVLCVDLEAQYSLTAQFVERCFSHPDVVGHWVCLPMNLRNAVSQFAPFWTCWDPGKESQWVRPMPEHPAVVRDESFFPFFRKGMEFEEFVVEYMGWQQKMTGGSVGAMIGIRTDESLNRWRTIFSDTKISHEGKAWTTLVFQTPAERAAYLKNPKGPVTASVYPIYDWRPADIWAASGRMGWDYNKVYDLMRLAGLTLHQMRLCQPYGDDQRGALWLYKILEPETWRKVVARVEGANFGARHAGARILGNFRIDLPSGHSWESYSKFLLQTMPPNLSEHYIGKINTFFRWWAHHCGGREKGNRAICESDTYDEMGIYTNPAIPYENYDGDAPGGAKGDLWFRIAKVLMKNDYWCKGIGFSQTKREHERLHQILIDVANRNYSEEM